MVQNRPYMSITFTIRTNGQVFEKEYRSIGGGAIIAFPKRAYFIFIV